jgi:hypothetical protein
MVQSAIKTTANPHKEIHMSDLADFVGVHVLDDAEVQLCLNAGALKGQQLFNALAPFGGTTTTPPLSLALMAQTYTLADLDDVNVVVNADALRSHPFMEAVLANGAA